MTTAQVVKTSVTVNNGPIKDYVHLDDHTQPTYEIIPGTKVFSLNFSSAGKGQFIAGKAKRCTRGAFSWRQGGSGLRDMAPPLLGNLETKPL